MISCTYCTFDNIDISEVKISDNTNHPTDFPGSSFKNVDFRNWNHGMVDFSAKLQLGCIFDDFTLISDTDLTGSNFSGVDLKNIIFNRGWNSESGHMINLSNVDFSFADLSHHDLTDANLEGANLKCINHSICNN